MLKMLPGFLISICISVFLFFNLGPGYVVQLDTVFGPYTGQAGLEVYTTQGSLYGLLLYFLSLYVPLDILGRIYISVIYGLTFCIPYYVVSRVNTLQTKLRSSLIALSIAIFYSSNPFVIGRMLSGQWNLVLGYACMPMLIYAFGEYVKNKKIQYVFLSAFVFAVQTIISIHTAIISFFIIFVLSVYRCSRLKKVTEFIPILSLILVSVPVLIRYSSYALQFIDTQAGIYHHRFSILHLFKLQGFWLDTEPWAQNMFIPYLDLGYIFGMYILGIYLLSKKRIGWILSLICMYIVQYMYIPYISVIYRDIGKLLIIPILFISFGLLKTLKESSIRFLVYFALCSICVFSTQIISMSQLHAYSYTESTKSISNILNVPCTALILPWYQYYSKTYIREGNAETVLSANPARHIYPCKSIQSLNTGLEVAPLNGISNGLYNSIDTFIHASIQYQRLHADEFLRKLKDAGVTHIIYDTSVLDEDSLRYPFLEGVEPIIHINGEIRQSTLLYEL